MNGIVDLLQNDTEYYDSQRVPGFVQGTVVENNNDKFKGMVKVEFTVWENGKNMCEWVRLLSPYTGNDYGLYLVPEIGETVLVGFIGGSLKRPFLLGSLYPSGAALVNENFDKKNFRKTLKTKGGTEILIQEEQGKQSVTVTTPKGSRFSVDDEKETCCLSDKDGKNQLLLNYKKGELSLEAEKKITLKAGSAELTLDGTGKSFEAKADKAQIKGTSGVKIETSNKLELKGTQTSVEGSAKLDLKSSGPAAVKGAIVQIN